MINVRGDAPEILVDEEGRVIYSPEVKAIMDEALGVNSAWSMRVLQKHIREFLDRMHGQCT